MAATPKHHPDEDLLLDFAGGQLDAAQRVLLEAHFAFCPPCTESVGALTDLGGRALAAVAGPAPPPKVWERIASRLQLASDDPLAGLPMPPAARHELPPLAGPLRWNRLPLTGGGRLASLWTDAGPGPAPNPAHRADLLVVQFPPGRRFPYHRHLGGEEVTVLAGGYRDLLGPFDAGDFGAYPPGSEHGPVTDDDEPCWILTRVAGGVRFTGWRGLLQRLAEAARSPRRAHEART